MHFRLHYIERAGALSIIDKGSSYTAKQYQTKDRKVWLDFPGDHNGDLYTTLRWWLRHIIKNRIRFKV